MLSIIIPVFNQHDMTEECLTEVLENTQDCEIIIVDNGSEPAIKPPFSGFIETTIIRNDENKGFPAAVNQGMRAARGDTIILLNNDVIVTPGWAEKLAQWIDAGYSIVGPVTNYAAGIQGVQIENYNDKVSLNKSAAYWAENRGNAVEEVNFVIGFCMAFKKSLFEEIGDFDESLWPCSGEEVDFCFRAREAGHKIGVVMGCYVHHEGSMTFKDMENAGQIDYLEICKINDEHIEKKWGKGYWGRQLVEAQLEPTGLCLNLGCGYRKLDGFVNIDNRMEVGPDLVCDVIAGLPYEDGSVDMVRAHDFLEHIPIGKVIGVMEEIWRVLKPGGIFESMTPSTDGRGAFQDPTHVSFWNMNSWFYYTHEDYRNLYGIKANFEIKTAEDIMTSVELKIIHTHIVAKAIK